jgi:hypothetical protein
MATARIIAMRRGTLFVSMGLLLGACASHEPVRTVDSSTYPALPPAVDVAVFTDAEQIKEPYEVIGPISYTDPGKYQMVAATNAVEPLKARARAIGGNGIIVGNPEPVKSGIVTIGITVEARAIRLTGKKP